MTIPVIGTGAIANRADLMQQQAFEVCGTGKTARDDDR